MPKVKEHHGIGNTEAGALKTNFVSSYMIVAPIFGYLGDRYSTWRLARTAATKNSTKSIDERDGM